MLSKSVLLLLIVTFTTQILAAIRPAAQSVPNCPHTTFLDKHVYSGAFNRQLDELKRFADQHAHDRLMPVSKQTVYAVGQRSEKDKANFEPHGNDKCRWKTDKTKYVFSRQWTCVRQGNGEAGHAPLVHRGRSTCPNLNPNPNPYPIFLTTNGDTEAEVERFATNMAANGNSVASGKVYVVTPNPTWKINGMNNCVLETKVSYYVCSNSWQLLDGPTSGRGLHLRTNDGNGHLEEY